MTMRTCLTVARKELHDHRRDIRSLGSTALYALMGPAVVGVVSLSAVASGPRGSYVLFSMASVFVLVAAFTGGMNVAIDVTAGERERRSLVPLLLNRASWQEILVGKWIAVSIFTVGSLTVTLAGFAIVLAKDAPESFVAAAPPFFGWLCLGLIPLALMGAALQLLVSTRCRSTKEAQSWLMMVVFVPMVAGMGVVFFPGWTDRWWMIAPIVGQQVMIAGGLGGDGVSLLESLTLAGTTAACTIAMLFVGSAGLNQDDVLAD
jgi:sodium transport system permease protein